MKKKLIAISLVMAVAISLSGCFGVTPSSTTKETSKEVTTTAEKNTTEDTTTVDTTTESANHDGFEKFENIYYILSDKWQFYQDQNGTLVYQTADKTESMAIYVQNETLYSADDMYTAYDNSVTSVYGTNATPTKVQIGDLEWVKYQYSGDNDLNTQAAVDVYVYSDGATTIYIENAFPANSSASGLINELLESIIIE